MTNGVAATLFRSWPEVAVHRFHCVPLSERPRVERLTGAHLLGPDSVPTRGVIELVEGVIECDGRTEEALALSLLWDVSEFGRVQIDTTRVPMRKLPYVLQVELARRRLMQINFKREEWGLYDYSGMEEIARGIDEARDAFIASLENLNRAAVAAKWADLALSKAVQASEQMAQFHAAVFINRRQQSRGLQHAFLGAAVPTDTFSAEAMEHLADKFDFVRVPFVWREIQATEQKLSYESTDAWIKAARKAGLTVHGGPVLSFGVRSLPDWMYIWENDPDTVLDYARTHVEKTVKRYAKDVATWSVCSGLHANDALQLNFEHMIELTRMAATTTKKLAPQSQVVIDLTQPWGEYFARNPRTVPPLLYAEMVAQSGIKFDAFGLQFLFGVQSDGYHLRDLFQIASLIDRLANLGKPIHISAVSVPSAPASEGNGGLWRGEWSEETQAQWLQQFCEIALSRPFVETVCLQSLVDGLGGDFGSGGVLDSELEPKEAYHELVELREELRAGPI